MPRRKIWREIEGEPPVLQELRLVFASPARGKAEAEFQGGSATPGFLRLVRPSDLAGGERRHTAQHLVVSMGSVTLLPRAFALR